MGTDPLTPQELVAELARIPDVNPGPVVHLDRAGVIVLGNVAARTFFDCEELVGRSWSELCNAMEPEAWEAVLERGEQRQCELERGGRCVMFTHVRSPTDRSVFAFGADITERRMAERTLAQQAEQLAEMARFPDMNPGPVVRLALDGCVLRANTAALATFGDGLVGRSWLEVIPGISRAQWEGIRDAEAVVVVEARVADRDFVLTHRRDHQGQHVFAFGADVSAQKKAERALLQTEKLATLGTLAAGVAHELNNPAAATRRAADQLREAIVVRERTQKALEALQLPAEAVEQLHALDASSRRRASVPRTLDSIERSDREGEMEEWLDAREVPEGWSLAPSLVAQNVTTDGLEALEGALPAGALATAVQWLAAGYPVHALLREIGDGTARISEIVQALKSYSYLGQAPVQEVDLREGIDSTLIILRSKLKEGVAVKREFDPELPAVPAWGSELNQVWTNLIDNAVDAMGGKGSIVIRTRREGKWAVVEVEDDGPGIPPAIQSRIFDPFFTTKEPGKGTGLGLATSHSIVTEKHKGRLSVESSPAGTRFTVMLPLTTE